MRRLLPLLLLTPALPGCGGPAGVDMTLKGKPLVVDWVRGDPDRATAVRSHAPLAGNRGILVGYDVDRYHHYFTAGSANAYDVAWISPDRKVVATGSLPANSEPGLNSPIEVRYALFLPAGWLKANEAGRDDSVTFGPAIDASPAEPLPPVTIGGLTLPVEIMSTNAERNRGLMYRRKLSDFQGMLFTFRAPRDQSFYMLHCHFPIDIAFFDADGKLLNVVDTPPNPDPSVDNGGRSKSKGPAKYVVETNRGWFKANGLADADGRPAREVRLELSTAALKLAERSE